MRRVSLLPEQPLHHRSADVCALDGERVNIHTCQITDATIASSPSSFSAKPQRTSRRVPVNASARHAGWKTKISVLVPFDAYAFCRTPIVSVLRATREICIGTTHQAHNRTFLPSVYMGVPRGMESVA